MSCIAKVGKHPGHPSVSCQIVLQDYLPSLDTTASLMAQVHGRAERQMRKLSVSDGMHS